LQAGSHARDVRKGTARRLLLFAFLAAPAFGRQPDRMSKQEAAYQDQPRGGLRCAGCTLFVKPDACKVVEGAISPTGWCRLFDMVD
jgi:hypothetical protein